MGHPLKIVHVNSIGNGFVADFIGGAVGVARFGASSGQPNRESSGIMITTVTVLGERRTTKFTAPPYECVFAEPTSVSPDNSTIDDQNTLNTRAMPKKISGVRGWPLTSLEAAPNELQKVVSMLLTHSGHRSRPVGGP